MAMTYRRMQPDEEHAVLSLWSEVFDISYEQERRRFVSDPQRFDRTFVAVAPDGGVLSTAHYFNSLRRDADGAPRLVGHVDPVATRPDAQRQGHASRLLELTIEAMR